MNYAKSELAYLFETRDAHLTHDILFIDIHDNKG